jgi:hypothetical protein
VSKSKKRIHPNWRPNFVNAAELPDIKIVRTDFIINIVAVGLMSLLAFYVLQREYKAHVLGQTVAQLEERIRASEADDRASIKLSEAFKKKAAHVVELEKFYLSPFLLHDFFARIAELRPEELIFNRVSFAERVDTVDKKKQLVYKVTVEGDVRSLTVLDEFKGVLAEADVFDVDGYALEISETMGGRDAKTGIFTYTLDLTLVPSKGGGKS